MKKRRLRSWVITVILLVSLAVFIGCGVKLLLWHKDNKNISKIEKELKEKVEVKDVITDVQPTLVNPPEDEENLYWDFIDTPFIDVDFETLLEINPDTIGWIEVKGTNINYPIVQSNDNDYYLYHAFDKSYNEAGWIFNDYRNNFLNDENNVIYGHSRIDQTMFGTLDTVLTNEWLNNKNNWIIRIATPDTSTVWQIFSVYTIPVEDYYIETDFSNIDFNEFINTMKNRSIYDFSANVSGEDKIITLSTCKNHTNRLVVHAKLIKTDETSH